MQIDLLAACRTAAPSLKWQRYRMARRADSFVMAGLPGEFADIRVTETHAHVWIRASEETDFALSGLISEQTFTCKGNSDAIIGGVRQVLLDAQMRLDAMSKAFDNALKFAPERGSS